MPESDDIALLKEFAEENSEAAFTALVERHVNLVYSTALRSTSNPHAAQEISQAVFIILARKAKSLGTKTILSGWLYQTTRLTAANYLRGEIRRQHREQEAYMQSTLNETANETWLQIAPLLDDAMARLGERDRNAIVLRFFENKNLSEVGAALGASEDAAKMRVNRALEKLRKIFSKRGVDSTTAILGGAISTNSIHAAPIGLAKTISAVAIAKGAAVSGSTLALVKGTLKIMTYAKLKLTLGIGMAALLASGVVTIALSADATKPAAAKPGSAITQTNLLIAAEFIEAPDGLLANLDVQWRPADSGGATAVLTHQQHTNLIGALKRDRTATVLSGPRMAFGPPEPGKTVQGTMSVLKAAKVSGTNAETGTILGVTASLSSDSKSVNLILTPELRELVDLSPQQDGSQNTIRTTKAPTETTLTLNPNQTILIRPPVIDNGLIPGGNAGVPKSLVVFVTPQLSRVTQQLQKKIIKVSPTH